MGRKSRFRRNLVDLGDGLWFVDLEKTHGIPMTMSFEIAREEPGEPQDARLSGVRAGFPPGPEATGRSGCSAGEGITAPSGPPMGRAERRRQAVLDLHHDRSCRALLARPTSRLTRRNRPAVTGLPSNGPGPASLAQNPPDPGPDDPPQSGSVPFIPKPWPGTRTVRSDAMALGPGAEPVADQSGATACQSDAMADQSGPVAFRPPIPASCPDLPGQVTLPSSPPNRILEWHRFPLVVFGLLAAMTATLWAGLGMSCAPAWDGASRQLSIMTWNVQNLFDASRDGGEYSEFTPPAWTFGAYRQRLETLASVLALLPGASIAGVPSAGTDGGQSPYPHILVFQELENRKVLQDLAAAFASEAGRSFPYTWLDVCPKVEDSPVTMGMLAWKAPSLQRSHRVWVNGSSSRLVWELHFDLDDSSPGTGEPQGEGPDAPPVRLVLFANHWKSKAGDAPDAEDLRFASARIVGERTRELMNDGVSTVFVCTGDLNTQGLAGESGQDSQALLALQDWEGSPSGLDWLEAGEGKREAGLCLLPPAWSDADASRAAHLGDVPGLDSSRFWAEPWCSLEPGCGSYFYDGAWERIDHILARSGGPGENPLAKPLGRVRMVSFGVPEIQGLADQSGLPRRFVAATGTGVSDHLPILLRLDLD